MAIEPIRRVIVATDFSTGSRAAVERAVLVAREHRACLELLHAFDNSAWQSLRAVFDAKRLSGDPPPEVALREQLAADAAELAQREALEVESHFGGGTPAEVIAARVKATHAALVVVARRSDPNAPGASSTLLRVLSDASCPLLVARAGPAVPYGNVLSAVDLREVSRRAAAKAMALFPSATHRLLYIVDPQWERAVRRKEDQPFGELIASLHAQAAQRLEVLAAELRDDAGAKVAPEAAVVDAVPALGIVTQAATWPADCVVVGRHGQGLVAETLLGSTALDVIHHSGRDVLVVS